MNEEPEHEVDWFGYPVRPDRDLRPIAAVPCPHCGEPFDNATLLSIHFAGVHGHRARRAKPPSNRSGRFRNWVEGLAYLPVWFVVPLNLGITAVLATAWWSELALFSTGDQTGVLKTWIVRLSLLPVTCYLAARVATIKR